MTLNGTFVNPNSWAARAHLQTGGVYDPVSVRDINAKIIYATLKGAVDRQRLLWIIGGVTAGALTTALLVKSTNRLLKNHTILKWTVYYADYMGGCFVGSCFIMRGIKIAESVCQRAFNDPIWANLLTKCLKSGDHHRGLVSAASLHGIDLSRVANS